MRASRVSKGLGIAAASVLALTACASTGGSDSDSGSDSKSITIAETNTFSSLNSDSSAGNSDINGKIAQLTHNGFQKVTDDLKERKNEDFGKMEVLSKDPLKVKYTIKDDVKWSDGEAIDAKDLLLEWAINSGQFGPESGKYFDIAGDTTGLKNTKTPEIGDDGHSLTLEYTKPFVDYDTALDMTNSGNFALPAHILAKKAGISEDDLIKAIKDNKPDSENPTVKKVADVWNKKYDTTTMPDDKDLLVSSGPYKIKDIVENQSVTLERNDSYKGPKPKIDEITVRTMGDANAQIQALNNGEVDVIAPISPSVDTINQIKDADSVKTAEGNQLAYDHLDLNFGSDVFKDENTRKAFLLTVPRQQMVDKLIKPMKSDAEVLNSQIFVKAQDPYADAVKNNGSDEYSKGGSDEAIAQAKKLLGGKTPTVKVLYNNGNPQRADYFQMVQQSAAKAGFKLVDGGAADWSKQLPEGNYDASIFGWVSPGVGHTMYGQIFKTGGGGNYNKFSNKDADSTIDELNTTVDNESKVNELGAQVDKDTFSDAYGLPIVQNPGIVGYKDNVKGFEKYNPTQTGVFWNVEDWDKTS